ncbi:uncharacterized protein LOC127606184, partial [Hippocampus zosterae]|uniref:uncharacterized protein LOC127606184 n=1 Tax=Hippocampus zosterae TaxID=109293 RepID=UPI00223E56BF
MSQKTPQCSADKPSNGNPADSAAIPAAECPNSARQNGGTSSSPESGSSNGDTKRSGKRRRGKKSTRKAETPCDGAKTEDQSERRAGPTALQAECANVWFQRSVYERAESLYQRWLANSAKASAESNGSAASPPRPPMKKTCRLDGTPESSQWSATHSQSGSVPTRDSAAARAPEEGRRSPVSAGPRQTAPPPPTTTTKRALNGLSPVFAEMLGDIWLEKPLYDRAEAAFYQSVFGNNCRQGSASSGTCPPPSSTEAGPAEQRRAAAPPQAKSEAFHALHPIQEEDEPAETLGQRERLDAGAAYFLHPDGERVWLDKRRYDAAEMRFHARRRAQEAGEARRPKTDTSSPPDVAVPSGEKYDPSRRLDKRQTFDFSSYSFSSPSAFFFFSIVSFLFFFHSVCLFAVRDFFSPRFLCFAAVQSRHTLASRVHGTIEESRHSVIASSVHKSRTLGAASSRPLMPPPPP